MFEDREKSEAEVQEKKEKEDAMGLEKADVFGMKVQLLQHIPPPLAVCSCAYPVSLKIASQQLHTSCVTPHSHADWFCIPCSTNNVSLTFPLGMQPDIVKVDNLAASLQCMPLGNSRWLMPGTDQGVEGAGWRRCARFGQR